MHVLHVWFPSYYLPPPSHSNDIYLHLPLAPLPTLSSHMCAFGCRLPDSEADGESYQSVSLTHHESEMEIMENRRNQLHRSRQAFLSQSSQWTGPAVVPPDPRIR